MLIGFKKLFVLSIIPVLVVRAGQNLNETEKYKNYALSIIGLVELLRIESGLIDQLEKYEENLIEKLELMQFVLTDLRAENEKSAIDPDSYLKNPLNGFALVRRTHLDWVKWHELLLEPEAKPQIDFIEELKDKMPKAKDLREAAAGILRIQDTYEMSTEELARGFLYGKQYDARLSALDCYAIGRYQKSQLKFDSSVEWLKVSSKLFSANDIVLSDVLDFDEAQIWFTLWDSFIDSYKYSEAHEAIQRAIQLRPHDERLLEQQAVLRDFMSQNRLCRSGMPTKSRLYCRYNSKMTPFLKLAPLKIEQITLDPYIVLYHDVIYDSEIEELQSIALPNLKRSEVSRGEVDSDRAAQSYNVLPKDSALLAPLFQRFDDMSGLDWSDAPHMQVINYGIGGHFNSHTDYFNLTMFPEMARNSGDRLAVILLYLSDVEMGGATAFPNLQIVVQPKRGTALLWYNLDNAGNCDSRTLHAGCPVLMGSKWREFGGQISAPLASNVQGAMPQEIMTILVSPRCGSLL